MWSHCRKKMAFCVGIGAFPPICHHCAAPHDNNDSLRIDAGSSISPFPAAPKDDWWTTERRLGITSLASELSKSPKPSRFVEDATTKKVHPTMEDYLHSGRRICDRLVSISSDYFRNRYFGIWNRHLFRKGSIILAIGHLNRRTPFGVPDFAWLSMRFA